MSRASNDLGIGLPVDPGTLAIVAGPANGTVAVDNGSVIYTPAANFSGLDTFRYTVRDVTGFESDAGTVTITVIEVPDYQNPDLPADVNRSGVVTPLDVLIGINRINAAGRQLPPDPLPPALPVYYYDVDGNNVLEPVDLLIIINYLNRNLAPVAGEGGDGGTRPLAAVASARALPLPRPEVAGTSGGADERPGANLLPPPWSSRHDTALAAFQQQTADPHSIALDDVLSLLAAEVARGLCLTRPAAWKDDHSLKRHGRPHGPEGDCGESICGSGGAVTFARDSSTMGVVSWLVFPMSIP